MRTFTTTAFTLILSLLALTTEPQAQTDSLQTYWTSGIRLNQGHLVGMLGITRQLSGRLYAYAGADLGGKEYAAYGATALRVTPPNRFTLFALLGPQLERVETDDNPEQLTSYLAGATGILGAYDIKPDIIAWLGVTYLITDAELDHWKLGLGLSLPVNF